MFIFMLTLNQNDTIIIKILILNKYDQRKLY